MKVVASVATAHASYQILEVGVPGRYRARVTAPVIDFIQFQPTTLPNSLRALADHIEYVEKTVSKITSVLGVGPGGG